MSLFSFLKKIWANIATFFSGLLPEVKTAIHIGVNVTEGIKAVIDSPVADVLTAIIPGDLDDTIKNKLREALPKILSELKLADKCGQLTDPEAIVKCAVETLSQISGDYRSGFLHNISILVAQVAADGKLSWSDGVYLLQWLHDHKNDASNSGDTSSDDTTGDTN